MLARTHRHRHLYERSSRGAGRCFPGAARIAAALLLCGAGRLAADPVSFEFTGRVVPSRLAGGHPPGVGPGTAIRGRFTFDSEAIGRPIEPADGPGKSYVSAGKPYGGVIEVEVAGEAIIGSFDRVAIEIQNDARRIDYDPVPALADVYRVVVGDVFSITLVDPYPTSWTDDALPLEPPVLGEFLRPALAEGELAATVGGGSFLAVLESFERRLETTRLSLSPDVDLVHCGTAASDVILDSPWPVQALSFGIRHDPFVLEAVAFEPTAVWDGKPPGFLAVNLLARGGSEDCGVPLAGITVGMLGSIQDPERSSVPAGPHRVVGRVRFRAAPTARTGSTSIVDFISCLVPIDGSPPTPSVVTIYSETVTPGEVRGGRVTVTDGPCFRRGRCNDDGIFDISDPIAVLLYLFSEWEAPGCFDACDANDDGQLDVSDGIYLLGYLFLGGPPPPAPEEICGLDLTADGLGCDRPSSCVAPGTSTGGSGGGLPALSGPDGDR